MEGTFGDDICWSRHRGESWRVRWGSGSEARGAIAGSQMGQGSGGLDDQMAGEGGDGRGQEGQMAVDVGGGAGGG